MTRFVVIDEGIDCQTTRLIVPFESRTYFRPRESVNGLPVSSPAPIGKPGHLGCPLIGAMLVGIVDTAPSDAIASMAMSIGVGLDIRRGLTTGSSEPALNVSDCCIKSWVIESRRMPVAHPERSIAHGDGFRIQPSAVTILHQPVAVLACAGFRKAHGDWRRAPGDERFASCVRG